MGVVRERKAVCESASNVPSNPESTANSGYTTQDSEDEEHQEVQGSPRRQPLRNLQELNLNFNQNITKHSGKRKIRRALNSRFLETLIEENESDQLLENRKSKFQILIEFTSDAIEFLNNYRPYQEKEACGNEACERANPYLNIPRKIRTAIRNRKNFRYDLLKSIELNLAKDFYPIAMEFYYYPDTCYERLLVHAVAKYNGFFSETVLVDDKKAVKVTYVEEMITPRVQMLCDYIEGLRSSCMETDT